MGSALESFIKQANVVRKPIFSVLGQENMKQAIKAFDGLCNLESETIVQVP